MSLLPENSDGALGDSWPRQARHVLFGSRDDAPALAVTLLALT